MPVSAGNPVIVGPYKRIVAVNWPVIPDLAPKYLVAYIQFERDSTFVMETGSITRQHWDNSYGISHQWMQTQTTTFIVNNIFDYASSTIIPVTGGPSGQAQVFSAWEYVDQRSFTGGWWAFDAHIITPLTGAIIPDADPINSVPARLQTTLELSTYNTPFSGGPNLQFIEIGDDYFYRRFEGAPTSFDFSVTVLSGVVYFDFSNVQATFMGKHYTAYGLYIGPYGIPRPYGLDPGFSLTMRVLLKKDGA